MPENENVEAVETVEDPEVVAHAGDADALDLQDWCGVNCGVN
jgi:hypothetical protein